MPDITQLHVKNIIYYKEYCVNKKQIFAKFKLYSKKIKKTSMKSLAN